MSSNKLGPNEQFFVTIFYVKNYTSIQVKFYSDIQLHRLYSFDDLLFKDFSRTFQGLLTIFKESISQARFPHDTKFPFPHDTKPNEVSVTACSPPILLLFLCILLFLCDLRRLERVFHCRSAHNLHQDARVS